MDEQNSGRCRCATSGVKGVQLQGGPSTRGRVNNSPLLRLVCDTPRDALRGERDLKKPRSLSLCLQVRSTSPPDAKVLQREDKLRI